jgi:hypothetical protein
MIIGPLAVHPGHPACDISPSGNGEGDGGMSGATTGGSSQIDEKSGNSDA